MFRFREGYPFVSTLEGNGKKMNFSKKGEEFEMCDFFESMGLISRIHYAINFAFDELCDVHDIQNGMDLSTLQTSLISEIYIQWKTLLAFLDEPPLDFQNT